MDRIPTKTKRKMHAVYTVFYVLEVFLTKICKIQPLDLLFIVFTSFYISKYHFSHIFKTSFSIIWKKYFCHKFSFFNRFTQTPQPLNCQNPLRGSIHTQTAVLNIKLVLIFKTHPPSLLMVAMAYFKLSVIYNMAIVI